MTNFSFLRSNQPHLLFLLFTDPTYTGSIFVYGLLHHCIFWIQTQKKASGQRRKGVLGSRDETERGPTHFSQASMARIVLDGELKALANEDTLLPTQMFPRLPARATFVADTNFVSGTQKMFLILFRNILCPQQMFPSLREQGNVMSNNIATLRNRAAVKTQDGRMTYKNVAQDQECSVSRRIFSSFCRPVLSPSCCVSSL